MLLEMSCIVGGVPLGYLLRKKPLPVRWANASLAGIIYVLLFLMGVSLGGNADLLARVADLGLRGVFIGLLCGLGSVAGAFVLHRFLFRELAPVAAPSADVPKMESRSPSNAAPCTEQGERL